MERTKFNRITIGVLTGYISSSFYRAMVQGIEDAAQENDVNIIFFAGGAINPPTNSRHRNVIYDGINKNVVDGIVIPTSLFRYLAPRELQLFLERFSGIPMVNIGSPLAGVTSVAPDLRAGMEQLMHHLVIDHGYRRIALIRGPQYHYDSETRYQVYRELLEKFDIPFREELVVSVDMVTAGGREGIDKLQKQAGMDYDVITVVGDQMAIRVAKLLQEKGVRIPEDIKVVGLQGVSDGQFFDPPLTVVDDTIYNQAKKGLENLLSILKGVAVPELIWEPTGLVIRHSCGCSLNPNRRVEGSFQIAATLDTFIKEQRQEVMRQMNREAAENSVLHRCQLEETELEQVLNALVSSLNGEPGEQFSAAVEDILEKVGPFRYKLLPWVGALLVLYRIPEGKLTVTEKERWDKLWTPVLAVMNQHQGRTLRRQEQGFLDIIDVFRGVAEALFSEYRPVLFNEVLADAAGIANCYVVLFDNHQPGKTGKLIVAYTQKQALELPDGGEEFLVNQFLPTGVLTDGVRFTVVAQSLYSGATDFGYIVNSMDVAELSFYTAIQTQPSGALNNQYQLQELRLAEQRFSDIAYSSSDWLWETDQDGRFTYCSGGVYGVLGYYAHELIGRTIFDFLAPSETDYRAYLQNELFQSKEPIRNLENWNLHRDGNLVGLLITGTPILKEDGTLIGYRGLFKDITERKKAEEEIRQIAYYDRLTGLPNRVLLMNRLEEALTKLGQESGSLAVLFIDLDRFKNVNDNLGHDVGDRLLRLVAERMKNSVREEDMLVRLGGDEFVVLLNDSYNSGMITNVCRRIFASLESPFNLNGYHFFVTCSVGIAVYPQDGTDAATLMKNADTAMYRSKSQGRNRFAFYDGEIESHSINGMRLENNLHQALVNDEFFLEYQPQVDTLTGKMIGLEALIRWNSLELGLVLPDQFIPVAEETGLIIPIGEWVLKTAIQQILTWRKMELPPLRVAINVSAQQFLNGDLVEVFGKILQESGVDPRLVQLEITEGAFVENLIPAHQTLERLKNLGFTIALDDFGTGYSSLSCLKRFPLDVVKIDQSFIRDLTTDSSSAGIVNAVVLMIKSLKLKVIAEGVETHQQLAALQLLECDAIQGMLFGRPLSAEAVTELISLNLVLTPIENERHEESNDANYRCQI